MVPTYKEARFPADYREAEVRRIMDAVHKLRSIAVTGLAGMGKSNVVRFIVSHPQVRARYLGERAEDYAFVHVDCAGLARADEAEILGEIAAQLRYEGIGPDGVHPHRHPQDIRRALKQRILALRPDLNLVLVMDYFDEAAAKLDRAFFNYLFHLRNARPRGNLMYVFATRRPIGPLYELHELLDDGYTIGPLSYGDALASIRRDEARLGCTFTPTQRDRLIAWTSGHPGFLKNACELLTGGHIDTGLPDDEIAHQLLRSEKVRRLCRELWDDMATAEQALVLKAVAGAVAPGSADADRVAYLERTGILVRREGGRFGPSLDVFSPLFGAFVRETHPASSGALRITAAFPNRARIEAPADEERVPLSPKLFALLAALADERGRVCTADELIARVYGDEAAGVTNAALSQLVKRLRGRVDPPARRMSGDPTYTCVETIRDVGYKLNG